MAIEIKVPPLGESLVDAVVGTWLKSEGESISRGETILELETDKVNLEVTAEDDGVESLALAHASLFAALATLVRTHGEEATALLVAGLPDRIRSGEYDLDRMTH